VSLKSLTLKMAIAVFAKVENLKLSNWHIPKIWSHDLSSIYKSLRTRLWSMFSCAGNRSRFILCCSMVIWYTRFPHSCSNQNHPCTEVSMVSSENRLL
jgi:hypothetical protein